MFEKEERMKKAIAAVKAKQFCSAEAAAEHFSVPPSTLGHRLRGRVSHQESLVSHQKLTTSQEEELV